MINRRRTRRVTLREETRSRSAVRKRRLLEQREEERELVVMRRQMERMASKIQQMESGKRWAKKGNEKQFMLASNIR